MVARHLSSLVSLALLFILTGCPARHHAQDVQSGLEGDRLTVGNVQREIHKGMSGSEVAEALGSPNVVSTDEAGREVWVYDKFATDVVASGSSWSIFGLGGGFGHSGAGGGGIGAGGSAARGGFSQTMKSRFSPPARGRCRTWALRLRTAGRNSA